MERFHSEQWNDTTDDEKGEGVGNQEDVSDEGTEDDFHNDEEEEEEEEEIEEEEAEIEEVEIEEEEEEEDADDAEGRKETGNQARTIKLQSPPPHLRTCYDGLNQYSKIHPDSDCFISGGKTRGGFIRKNVEELILELSTKFHSCEHLQESDFDKVFDDFSVLSRN
jgi:hypothetical protein